jgi:hypothetical protein
MSRLKSGKPLRTKAILKEFPDDLISLQSVPPFDFWTVSIVTTSNDQPSNSPTGSGRFWKLIAISCVMLALLLLLAPTIIAKTSLRDRLINSAMANDSLVVSTDSASFGYLTPLKIRDFSLRGTGGAMNLQIENLETEKSWLLLLFSKGDLGTFRFGNPEVEVVTGIAKTKQVEETQEEGSVETWQTEPIEASDKAAVEMTENTPVEAREKDTDVKQSQRELPRLVAEITDASVRVRNVSSVDPLVDLDHLDFTVRIEDGTSSGSNVVVDPTTILDNAVLTPELCNQGLHLVAPAMSGVVNVTGNVSFHLDRMIVPVGKMSDAERQEKLEIAGAIEFSDVTVGLKSKLMNAIAPLLQRFGAHDAPSAMTISKASAVQFHVADGRIEHQGLVMQMPLAGSALEIASSGSVGVDESLDVQLAISIPDHLLGDSALAKFFQVESVQIQVSGTLDDPHLELDSTGGWTDRLHSLLAPQEPGDVKETAEASMNPEADVAESILGMVDGLLDRPPRDGQPVLPNLRDRLQSRREEPQGRRRLLPRRNRRIQQQ